MFSCGNSYNGSSNYGTTNATELGCLDTGMVQGPTPAWWLAVTVWHPRPGK